MSRPINGSDTDSLFEKDVEDEWEICVYKLNRIRSYDISNFSRYETMKRYWEDRLKALVPIIYKENTGWLKILEARYPSGVDWRDYLDEVLRM